MRLDPQRCSIVLLGTWNLAIFSPRWVSRRLFKTDQVDLEVAFGDALVLKFRDQLAELVVTAHAAQVVLRSADDAALVRALEIAHQLLSTLGETPVRALGLNLGFDLAPGDAHPDELRLIRERTSESLRPSLGHVRVHRTLVIDGTNVNVTLAQGSAATLDFNLHFELRSVDGDKKPGEQALEVLRKQGLAEARELSVRLAHDLYGIGESR